MAQPENRAAGPALNERGRGLIITALGVLVLTPDALLTRLIGCGTYTLIWWRGLLIGLALISFCFWRRRGGGWLRSFRGFSKAQWGVTVFYALDIVFFVAALSKTSVAATLIILAAAPLLSLILARTFLCESIRRGTALATLAAGLGIGLVFFDDWRGGSWVGNLLALACAFTLASQMVATRAAGRTNVLPSLALGGLLACVMVTPFAQPLSIGAEDLGYLLIMGLLVHPVSFGLISLGPRYLTAAEVNLLILLETIIGPFWVYLLLGETPGFWSWIGGATVISSLSLYFVRDFFVKASP